MTSNSTHNDISKFKPFIILVENKMYVSMHLGFEFGVNVHICKFILPGEEKPIQDTKVDRPSVEVEGWTSYEPIPILTYGR